VFFLKPINIDDYHQPLEQVALGVYHHGAGTPASLDASLTSVQSRGHRTQTARRGSAEWFGPPEITPKWNRINSIKSSKIK
jgi:hypothetical protein